MTTTYFCTVEGCSIGDCPNCLAVAALRAQIDWERKVAAEWKRAAELGDADCLAARAELAALRETCDRLALENVTLAAKLHMGSDGRMGESSPVAPGGDDTGPDDGGLASPAHTPDPLLAAMDAQGRWHNAEYDVERHREAVVSQLRTLRERAGLSCARVARAASISPAALSLAERGKTRLSSATVWRVLLALHNVEYGPAPATPASLPEGAA